MKVGNEFFESAADIKEQETKLTSQNCISQKIKNTSNSGNFCYHLVKDLASFLLLSGKMKIK
jgi:hypothetical protein